MSIRISKIGTLATIQDGGRVGYQAQGVPVGGAIDDDAWRLANLLVGNDQNRASLEVASGILELNFGQDCLMALAGGGMLVLCDGQPIPFNRRVEIRAGATLNFSPAAAGYWTYVAVAGGIGVEPILGSRSTYLPANFGGLQGRPLKKGDQLDIASNYQVQLTHDQLIRSERWGVIAQPNNDPIRVFCGPDWEHLTNDSQSHLLERNFMISSDSNRMGYRLSGQAMTLRDNTELISTPVTPGTIQIPPDGTPIVLMADAQTIGGYPRIAQVAAVDLPKLAQTRPGKSIRFQLISYDAAGALFLAREQDRKKTAVGIALRTRMS
jgi:antagonist of KipI